MYYFLPGLKIFCGEQICDDGDDNWCNFFVNLPVYFVFTAWFNV